MELDIEPINRVKYYDPENGWIIQIFYDEIEHGLISTTFHQINPKNATESKCYYETCLFLDGVIRECHQSMNFGVAKESHLFFLENHSSIRMLYEEKENQQRTQGE